jgi:cell shape-determining protein MreC
LRNALKFQNVKHEGKEAVFKKEIEIKDGIIREQKKELKEREIKINQIMVSIGQEQGKVGLLMEENTKLKDQLRLKAPLREEEAKTNEPR